MKSDGLCLTAYANVCVTFDTLMMGSLGYIALQK
jgi:hypothetical protein